MIIELLDIVNYSFTIIMIGVSLTWVIFLQTMIQTIRFTPNLDDFQKTKDPNPKVSIILPARNEQAFIGRCLDSLANQNYNNYEIIVVNDSSEDATEKIISEYAKKNSKIKPVDARVKPVGWMGKNWACMEGYRQATGELLLFTDADTYHAPTVISLAVGHLLSSKLDALSAIPKLIANDFWTKITLPMISIFLHTRFSAIRVNDPLKKTAYFFGSFFIISKKTYQEIGTHEGVKHEIIEDGALGKKVKEAGFRMKMVRGGHLIEAVWARDKKSLYEALKRLIVPLYVQSGKITIGVFFAVLFLLFMPFPFLIFSIIIGPDIFSSGLLFWSSLTASLLIYTGAIMEVKKLIHLRLIDALFAPLGSLVVVFGFMMGLLHAKKRAINWRGRDYSIKDHIQNSINL